MIIRAIDENGDFTFGKGKASYKKENEAIKQNIKTKLNEWKNDCYFNLTAGIDFLNRLEFGQKKLFTNEIKSLLLKCEGVVEIVNFNLDFDEKIRKITLEYNILTIYSQIIEDLIEIQTI